MLVLLVACNTFAALTTLVRRFDTITVAKAGVAVVAGLVAFTTCVSAINHSDVVHSGGTLTGLMHRLVGAPVRCVEPKWVGASESPLPANKYLLFLGTGDQTILYRPKHGPVPVPAGDVVLLPAAPSRCRS